MANYRTQQNYNQQQEQQELNFDKDKVRDLEENAEADKENADDLLNEAIQLKEKNPKKSIRKSTRAGVLYIEHNEKRQKAVLAAAGKETDTKKGKRGKNKVTYEFIHDQEALTEKLAIDGYEIVSKEDAKKLNNVNGLKNKKGSSYTRCRYGNETIDIERAKELKNISEETDKKYIDIKNRSNKEQQRKFIEKIAEDILNPPTS